MAAEKATALVLRTTDWSETSRIATLWTREFGKVRVLAKGGRRLKSNFESALDLLTLASIVLLRKSSGGLDLLTEARVEDRFPHLRGSLSALNAGYYVAELLQDGTQDYDPHPALFDEALAALREFGAVGEAFIGPRLAQFELTWLRELGFHPTVDVCADCGEALDPANLAFSAESGGMLCGSCQGKRRDRAPVSAAAWDALRRLNRGGDGWRSDWQPTTRVELRRLLDRYVTHVLGRRPRLLPYLGT